MTFPREGIEGQPAPWWEQYPPLTLDVELYIESARARMFAELTDAAPLSSDDPGYVKWIEKTKQKSLEEVDQTDFISFIALEAARHYQRFDREMNERNKGHYDEQYAERCRVYEQMLDIGYATRKWIKSLPYHDITKLPEPVMVNSLAAVGITGGDEREAKSLIRASERYRPR